MPFCSACGSKVEGGESFCPNCGQEQVDVTPVSDRRPPVAKQAKGIERKWISFGFVGLVVVAVIVGGVIFLAPPDIYGRYSVSGRNVPEDAVFEIERVGTFTMSGGGFQVTGTWKIEDDEILLTAEGETLRGRIDGNRIVLRDPSTGEEVMTLTRQ